MPQGRIATLEQAHKQYSVKNSGSVRPTADPVRREMSDLQNVPREARSHRRFPIDIVGTLELQDEGAHSPAYGIGITNVAPGGLGLTLRSGIPIGARVKLVVQGEVIHGVVSHCEKLHGEFSAGIAVDHSAGALARIGWIALLRPSAHPMGNHQKEGNGFA